MNPRFIESFGRLDLRVGDVLVLKVPGPRTQNEVDSIGRRLKEFLVENGFKKTNVMILTDGMDIGVMRPAEEAEVTAT